MMEGRKLQTAKTQRYKKMNYAQGRSRRNLVVGTLLLLFLATEYREIISLFLKAKGKKSEESKQHTSFEEQLREEQTPSELAVAMYGPYRTSEEKRRLFRIE